MPEPKETLTLRVSGVDIELPEGITYPQILDAARNAHMESAGYTDLMQTFPVIPFEGALALKKALTKIFPSSHWAGVDSAKFKLQLSSDEVVEVVWGDFNIPDIEGTFTCGATRSEGKICFNLSANIKRKDGEVFNKIVAEINKILLEEMIYKGRAFSIQFFDENRSRIGFLEPKIMNLGGAELPFLNTLTRKRIEVEIISHIQKSLQLQKIGIPTKKGILLIGPYGTGKTLLAKHIAHIATKVGWTFIYIKSATEYYEAYKLAQQYQPAVIFAEDLDRLRHIDPETYGNIANTLDGIDTKADQIVTIMTTNHPEYISDVLLRPGRFSAKIQIDPLEGKIALAMLVHLIKDQYKGNSDSLIYLVNELEGMTGAEIQELASRATVYALSIMGDTNLDNEALDYALKSILDEKGEVRSEQSKSQDHHEDDGGIIVFRIPRSHFPDFEDIVSQANGNNGKVKKRLN